MQPVYSFRVDSEDHAFLSDGFVSHNTECRLAPLAMEMLREIDQETVDFTPNYDGRNQEPTILPSRIPNLLVNGSSGIAVGMATNIPPHNLREVAAGVQWALENPEATDEALLEALLERIQGPDFPTGALIVGSSGIRDAYTTGRGSIRMRAVIEVDEDAKGRTILVVTELPYQVNPDNLAESIADLVRDGKIAGIADVRDEGSQRTGQRLVIVLKRDAVAKVVLNNLYKHTQLQYTFGANMLAIVDGVPKTLRLDEFVRHYVAHQVEVIVRRTRYQLRKAEERAHILRALGKALDRLDDVIALIRGAASADAARSGLMELLDIDELQAVAILDMQLRRLAALERQRILDELAEREREIADLQAILADPVRQRRIIGEELAEIVERYGDERRTRLIPFEGDMSAEDLITQEDVVVTVTRGGYAKRTRTDLYRVAAPRRHGRARGEPQAGRHRRALLRDDHAPLDPVLHEQGPGLPGQGARAARGRPRRPRQPRRERAGLPAGRDDRPGPHDPRLRGRAVPGARDPRRHREEDGADAVRQRPQQRAHRRQPARGRRADRRGARRAPRTTCCWSAAARSRSASRPTTTPCARWAATPAASAAWAWRDGDEVLAMQVVPAGQAGRARAARRQRRRLRQAHPARRVPPAGPRRQRHPHREVPRGPRRAGRRDGGAAGRRGLRHHQRRRRHPHAGRADPPYRPRHAGRQADGAATTAAPSSRSRTTARPRSRRPWTSSRTSRRGRVRRARRRRRRSARRGHCARDSDDEHRRDDDDGPDAAAPRREDER